MAGSAGRAAAMRKTFNTGLVKKQLVHWFPGHMAKGLRLMQQHLRRCDAVIEVHDARVPTTGRNYKFDLLAGKPRVVVLNKMDLAGFGTSTPESVAIASTTGAIYTNCLLQTSTEVLQIVPQILDMVDTETLKRQPPYLRIMVVGIPNVGKSSLINGLRRMCCGKGKAARTGNSPGVTRAVQTDIKIYDRCGARGECIDQSLSLF